MAYQLLPFRFERFNDNQYLLTNEVGEYVFLSNALLSKEIFSDMI